MHSYKRYFWLGTIFTLFNLPGCYKVEHFYPPQEEFRLPRHIEGARDKLRVKLPKKWGGRARLVTMGQEYLISIPANELFYDQSPRLTWTSYALLNDVVLYLKQFRKINIRVAAHSTCYISAQRESALTRARANAVGDYLWSQGVDSRFIFTEGQGSGKPIVRICGNVGDYTSNARIEIIFREAIV